MTTTSHYNQREVGGRDAAPWTRQVIDAVEARLQEVFQSRLARANSLSPRAHELVNAVFDLTMRGGKRVRSLMIYAGFCTSSERISAQDWDNIVTLAASVELLQTYLLIQDDWMDGDDERRGGPSIHSMFGRRVGDAQLGASLALLSSDVALGYALELLHATSFPPERRAEALAAFTDMHMEVVCGQQLDLLRDERVTLTHELKTGSYTVRGPLMLGAILADADLDQKRALTLFARPLGLAFQLRDELLGTFGDPRRTGKPTGSDLREGKRTALVECARSLLSPSDLLRFNEVLGNRLASHAAIEATVVMLERSGVRARVEDELSARIEEAQNVLRTQRCLAPDGVERLAQLTERIAWRSA